MEADHVMLISQLFPGTYDHQAVTHQTQAVTHQTQAGPSKPRRQRRKKTKGGLNEASSSGEAKKRKLSVEQMDLLEKNFGSEHKLGSERKDQLAMELGLDPRQVAVWFQNRRARWKNKKLEDEYSRLKSAHETTFLDKCRLETEVMKLKEQLSEATKEIQRLSVLSTPEYCGQASSNSPISSSISHVDPSFLGELGALEGAAAGYDEDVFYAIPNESHYMQTIEWFNQYM